MPKVVGSSAELKEICGAAGDKLVVIDFFAEWCGPCKMIAPKFAELEAANPDVVFLKVDVDEAGDIAEEFEVQAMPTFVFMKAKGGVLEKFAGANGDMIGSLVAKHK